MKKTIILTAITSLVLGVCFSCSACYAEIHKIAVIDIPTVVSRSAQVKVLKKEQAKKTEELQKWLKIATADVEKQQTKEGKQKLIKKYNDEYAQKQEAISKYYKQKLIEIDKSISSSIAQYAEANGYDMVITKSMVLYGGDDITSAVSKIVK